MTFPPSHPNAPLSLYEEIQLTTTHAVILHLLLGKRFANLTVMSIYVVKLLNYSEIQE